jgi:hypothetical protein
VQVLFTVVLLAVACLCAGCGQRSDDATAVVERFQTALDGGDGAGACAELSEQTASALEQQEGHPCDEAILDLDLAVGREVAKTSVYVTSASVSLVDGGTLFLDEASGGWEISAAGCRPSAPERPFDCEVED